MFSYTPPPYVDSPNLSRIKSTTVVGVYINTMIITFYFNFSFYQSFKTEENRYIKMSTYYRSCQLTASLCLQVNL